MTYRAESQKPRLRSQCIYGRSIRDLSAGSEIFFWICLIIMSAATHPALAQEASDVRVGTYVQKNAGLLPGFEVSYGSEALFSGHPRFALAYLTSRPSSALGSRAAVEDRLLLAAGWFFRPGRLIDPYVQLEAGYTRFDREDPEIFALLDNDAFIASILMGVEVRLFDSRFSVAGDAGYSILHSSTVYPFVTSFGIHYSLQPRIPR